ncbi:MAG: hypothetical protein EP343_25985 [Deltaproteobacteria bacterium]|nr:MAG: hypothetical protein EP343_25985 [Deltaproteobacteria bacterium]
MSVDKPKGSWWTRVFTGKNPELHDDDIGYEVLEEVEEISLEAKLQETMLALEQMQQVQSRLQDQNTKLNQDLANTRRERDTWRKQVANLERTERSSTDVPAQLKSTQDSLHELQEYTRKLQHQLESEQQSNQDMLQEFQEHEKSNLTLERKLSSAIRKLEKMEEQYKQARQQLMEHDKSSVDAKAQIRQLEHLLNEMTENMREEYSKRKQMEDERMVLFRQKEAVAAEKQALEEQLEELQGAAGGGDLLRLFWDVCASSLVQICDWSARLAVQGHLTSLLTETPERFAAVNAGSVEELELSLSKVGQSAGWCQSLSLAVSDEKVIVILEGVAESTHLFSASPEGLAVLQSPLPLLAVAMLQRSLQKTLVFQSVESSPSQQIATFQIV